MGKELNLIKLKRDPTHNLNRFLSSRQVKNVNRCCSGVSDLRDDVV